MRVLEITLKNGKFDYSIFEELTKMGLAERIDDDWFHVEGKTASELMTFLASVIGNIKGYIPATDKIDKIKVNRDMLFRISLLCCKKRIVFYDYYKEFLYKCKYK